MERVLIGCSGWNYADWRGAFYPEKGCPTSRWLEFYAREFTTVEVNSTFYRLARQPEAVARWLRQTPDDFWQLPENFHRDDERLRDALEHLPPGRSRAQSRIRSAHSPISRANSCRRARAARWPVFAYYNNDWNAYAIRNARVLKNLVSV